MALSLTDLFFIIAMILGVERYDDNSGNNFGKYETKNREKLDNLG